MGQESGSRSYQLSLHETSFGKKNNESKTNWYIVFSIRSLFKLKLTDVDKIDQCLRRNNQRILSRNVFHRIILFDVLVDRLHIPASNLQAGILNTTSCCNMGPPLENVNQKIQIEGEHKTSSFEGLYRILSIIFDLVLSFMNTGAEISRIVFRSLNSMLNQQKINLNHWALTKKSTSSKRFQVRS